MRIEIPLLHRLLCRRAVGRRLRIIEIVFRNGGRRRLYLRHLTRHDGPRLRSFGGIAFGIAHSRSLRGRSGLHRRSGLRGFYRPHAGATRIGVETGIAVENEIVFIAAGRISLKEDLAAALIRVLRRHFGFRGYGRGRRHRRSGRRAHGSRPGRNSLHGSGNALGLRQIVECDGLRLHGPVLRLARPCGREEQRAKRRCDQNQPERKQNKQRIENICAHRRERRTHRVGNEAEQHAAARSARQPFFRRRPAARKIAAVALRKKALGSRRMYDQKGGGQQKIDPHDPTRRNDLFAEDHHRRAVNGKHEQGIHKVPREPDKKCRNRKPDIAEYVRPRDSDKKNDRAEQEQRHAHRLFGQKRSLVFILLFLSATNSVQTEPPRILPSPGMFSFWIQHIVYCKGKIRTTLLAASFGRFAVHRPCNIPIWLRPLHGNSSQNLAAKSAKQSKAARRASQTRRSPQRVPCGTGKGFNKV